MNGEHLGHIRMAATTAQNVRTGRLGQLRDGSKRLARRSGSFLAGIGLTLFVLFVLVALVSYHRATPRRTRARAARRSTMGSAGAWTPPAADNRGTGVALFRRSCHHRPQVARNRGRRWLRAWSSPFRHNFARPGRRPVRGGRRLGVPAGWAAHRPRFARLVEAGLTLLGDPSIVTRSGSRSSPSPRWRASRSPYWPRPHREERAGSPSAPAQRRALSAGRIAGPGQPARARAVVAAPPSRGR